MKSTVTSKGQTTIPKRIRDALRLQEGTQIDWRLEADDTLTVHLLSPSHDPFDAALGAFPLPEGEDVAGVLEMVRGERDPDLAGGPGAQVVTLDAFLSEAGARR